MLSILIPVYNYQVVQLVTSLQQQCKQEDIEYEIIALDDTSTRFIEENKHISTLENCQFIVAENHLGRAKIRNKLAEIATGNFLLFIDADAGVDTSDFIATYISSIQKADVVVGGVKYSEQPPKENALRWYYGTQRECVTAKERNKHPYRSIVSFNILIKKSVFLQIEFDENSIDTEKSAYGHEDTLLGLELKEKSISLLHIDNSLIHNYGESDEIFLKNSLIAVEKFVTHPTFRKPNVVESIKIFKVFNRCKKNYLTGTLNAFYTLFNRSIKRYLFRPNPSLKLFDLYRLSYLAHFHRKQKRD
jgi:glycosyltransferase involved in cell wall biosynthesis